MPHSRSPSPRHQHRRDRRDDDSHSRSHHRHHQSHRERDERRGERRAHSPDDTSASASAVAGGAEQQQKRVHRQHSGWDAPPAISAAASSTMQSAPPVAPPPAAAAGGDDVAQQLDRARGLEAKLAAMRAKLAQEKLSKLAATETKSGLRQAAAISEAAFEASRPTPTLISNQRMLEERLQAQQEPKRVKTASDATAAAQAADGALVDRALLPRMRERRRGLQFFEEGAIVAAVEKQREKSAHKQLVLEIQASRQQKLSDDAEREKQAVHYDQSALQVLGFQQVPEAEWWDQPLLAHRSYDVDVHEDDGTVDLVAAKVTHLVEHPVPIEPPCELPPPPPAEVKLTKKEAAKLRRRRRLERQQQKTEEIQAGLRRPDEPKVKISNLMRVLTTAATLDPTRIEQEVRRQMDERRAAHEKANRDRQLAPEQKKEKKLKKILGKATPETHVAVFRIASLENPRNLWKVQRGATDRRLKGVVVITEEPTYNIVVVEGTQKAIRQYARLLLRRIDWNAPMPPPRAATGAGTKAKDEEVPSGGADAMERERSATANDTSDADGGSASGSESESESESDGDDAGAMQVEREPNGAVLCWMGCVIRGSFMRFSTERLGTISGVRAHLKTFACAHYADLADNFSPLKANVSVTNNALLTQVTA